MDHSARAFINTDLITSDHRISGVVNRRNRSLLDVFNADTTSIIELTKAFVSRLSTPGEIVPYTAAPVYVRKKSVLFAVMATSEKAVNARDAYTLVHRVEYRMVLNVAGFEVAGVLEALGRTDPVGFLATTDGFLCLKRARAVLVGTPVTFQGEEMLLNKAHIDLILTMNAE